MTRSLISAFIAVALILFIAGVRTQEVADETEYEYNDGPNGPAHWGELNDDWKACGNGKQQSPIDLVQGDAAIIYTDSDSLGITYQPANATLINRGHDITLKWPEGAGSIEIEGKSFTLNQCHWHSPAEHTLDGQQQPLEAHLVHQAEDGEIAVIGIIYEVGESDDFLEELMDGILDITDKDPPEEPLGMVDPNDIEFDISKYYRYDGSLTTPPCTEGVTWTVIYQVKTVSEDQVTALKAAVDDGYEENARPIQDLNGRTVSLYTPTDDIYVS